MLHNTPAITKYADIINLSRPIITTHPHLSAAQRAAQFAPYKTIVAYHDSTQSLEEASEITELEVIIDTTQLEGFDEFYADTMPEENNFCTDIADTADITAETFPEEAAEFTFYLDE